MHFSESMTIIIYNDACYICSAITLECNITVRKYMPTTLPDNYSSAMVGFLPALNAVL